MNAAARTTHTTCAVDGRRLEVARIAGATERAPIVLLHEGLGSIALWRDFPPRLAAATGREVVLYSRAGYGRSERLREARTPGYMHHEALVVLPLLLDRLGLEAPVLFGHSDGASIALIYAAHAPECVGALVLEAPHVFVEPVTVARIAAAKAAAATTDLLVKLARYHDDAASAFDGWSDIWLAPEFLQWNITGVLPAVRAPILMLQGRDDEYGTVAQLEAIAATVPHTTTVLLEPCGHSPHRTQTDAVLDRTRTFLDPIP